MSGYVLYELATIAFLPPRTAFYILQALYALSMIVHQTATYITTQNYIKTVVSPDTQHALRTLCSVSIAVGLTAMVALPYLFSGGLLVFDCLLFGPSAYTLVLYGKE